MVNQAADYLWSSHQHTAWGRSDPLVSPHRRYLVLGDSDLARREAYRALFCTQLSAETLDQVCAALQHNQVLGCTPLREQMAAMFCRRFGRAVGPATLRKTRTRPGASRRIEGALRAANLSASTPFPPFPILRMHMCMCMCI